jgi:hypothetical protein
MDTNHPNEQLERGGLAALLVVLLGVGAWLGAFAAWGTVDEYTVDPVQNYVGAIMLTVIGAALLIIAAVSWDR